MSTQPGRPASSLGFDWLMASLSVLLMAGVMQDGWAHSHGLVDQSFFTLWHAILYGSMAANGIVLGFVAIRNKMKGYSIPNALPYGYWLALGGVMLFAIGGGLDLLWHTAFGIETGISGLISPTHLLLAFSAALIFTGPIRSIALRYGSDTSGWQRVGPVVLSLTATLTLLGFFLSYAQPIADGHTKSSILRSNDGAAIAPLYALDPIAGHVTRLDVPPQLDIWGVSASPDGKHLVYRGQVPGSADGGASPPSDIYVADIDGKHAARITRTGRHDTQAAWSADGKWIAYISFPAGTSGNNSLHIIHPDGTGDRTIVDGVTRLSTPAWSPDGSHIVYGSRNGQSDMLAIADVASGATHWLTFSKDAELPAWFGARLFFTASGGSLVSTNVDGSDPRQIAAKGQTVAVSPDGKTIAYLARADGATQVFLAGGDGGHARNVSRLAGIDAAHPSIGPDGRVYFTAFSRPAPAHTFAGYSLAEASNLLESVLVAGILLIVLRRWRPPFGSITFALTLFSLAMATQSDEYAYIVPAFVTGLAADLAIAVLGDRARHGTGFYALAFLMPALFFALYLTTTIVVAGSGTAWTPNLLFGSPLLAGVAGLFVAFCFEPPLPAGPQAA